MNDLIALNSLCDLLEFLFSFHSKWHFIFRELLRSVSFRRPQRMLKRIKKLNWVLPANNQPKSSRSMSTFLKSISADCRSMHKWIFWLESIIATPKIHRDEWCRRVNASKFRFVETKQNQFRLRQWMYARGLWRFSVFLCDVEMLDECRRRCLPFCYHHYRRRHWELILFLIKNRIDFDAYQILIYTWKRHKCMRFNSTWVRENENERSQWIFEEWKKKLNPRKIDFNQMRRIFIAFFRSVSFYYSIEIYLAWRLSEASTIKLNENQDRGRAIRNISRMLSHLLHTFFFSNFKSFLKWK